MKATRDGFGDQLVAMATNERLVVVNADLGKATKAAKFGEVCPDRFFEVGIAEANMIGVASGLSEHGFKVVISSFASFITGRYDIIRCSLAYSNRPVIIVGTHSGMAIGKDGVTQMGLEDVNVMRGLPNMQIVQPASYLEARHITEYVVNDDKLTYVRLGRQPVPEMFNDKYQFEFGKGQVLLQGKDIAIISTGCVLSSAYDAARKINATLVNMPTLKPIDKDMILQLADRHKLITTVEDHSIIGGLGSAASEVMATDGRSKLLRIGIQDVFVESGDPDDLYAKYGLDNNGIIRNIKTCI